jgi:hypothetical protein
MNKKCPICESQFNMTTVKVKDTIGFEGVTIYIFDCPCCEREINIWKCKRV